jgi:magnesium transporter
VHATISTPDGDRRDATADDVSAALAGARFFWLDLTIDADDGAGAGAIGILRDVFKFHPLAVEDAEHFGQRPKFDDYDDYGYMVVDGAGGDETGTQELHLFVSVGFVVTLHRGTCPSLDAVHARIARHHLASVGADGGQPGAGQMSGQAPTAGPAPGPADAPGAGVGAVAGGHLAIVVVYLVVDALTDSFFPVLSSFDDKIDDLETSILAQPTETQLGQIFAMKRQLLGIRKVIGPQRDMFAGVTAGVTELPGMSEEGERYFRDLYDHLIRIGDMVDGYRDLVSGVMDTHLSTVSNRLNVVMKQLAIIATVFLPLSFLTGFFGQNFSWLVDRIGGLATFVGVGIGLELVAVLLLVVLFKRRGWLGGPTA